MARFHCLHFRGAQIYAKDVIPLVRETCRGDRADVTQAENAN